MKLFDGIVVNNCPPLLTPPFFNPLLPSHTHHDAVSRPELQGRFVKANKGPAL